MQECSSALHILLCNRVATITCLKVLKSLLLKNKDDKDCQVIIKKSIIAGYRVLGCSVILLITNRHEMASIYLYK